MLSAQDELTDRNSLFRNKRDAKKLDCHLLEWDGNDDNDDVDIWVGDELHLLTKRVDPSTKSTSFPTSFPTSNFIPISCEKMGNDDNSDFWVDPFGDNAKETEDESKDVTGVEDTDSVSEKQRKSKKEKLQLDSIPGKDTTKNGSDSKSKCGSVQKARAKGTQVNDKESNGIDNKSRGKKIRRKGQEEQIEEAKTAEGEDDKVRVTRRTQSDDSEVCRMKSALANMEDKIRLARISKTSSERAMDNKDLTPKMEEEEQKKVTNIPNSSEANKTQKISSSERLDTIKSKPSRMKSSPSVSARPNDKSRNSKNPNGGRNLNGASKDKTSHDNTVSVNLKQTKSFKIRRHKSTQNSKVGDRLKELSSPSRTRSGLPQPAHHNCNDVGETEGRLSLPARLASTSLGKEEENGLSSKRANLMRSQSLRIKSSGSELAIRNRTSSLEMPTTPVEGLQKSSSHGVKKTLAEKNGEESKLDVSKLGSNLSNYYVPTSKKALRRSPSQNATNEKDSAEIMLTRRGGLQKAVSLREVLHARQQNNPSNETSLHSSSLHSTLHGTVTSPMQRQQSFRNMPKSKIRTINCTTTPSEKN